MKDESALLRVHGWGGGGGVRVVERGRERERVEGGREGEREGGRKNGERKSGRRKEKGEGG